MHVHFSTFNHVDNNTMNVPSGPRLNSETAMSARSYLSTIELGGDIDGWKLPSGISFSRLMPDGQRFDVSDDGRFLLCFDTVEIYAVQFLEYEELRRYIVTHRANLLRADRLCDHQGLIDRRDPWFKYQVFTPMDDRSTRSLMHYLEDQLRQDYGASRAISSLDLSFQLPFGILERLWVPERPNEGYTVSDGRSLSEMVMDWGGQEAPNDDADDENEWLHDLLMLKIFFDTSLVYNQQRITDYFNYVDT
jgi:hypothetical protein